MRIFDGECYIIARKYFMSYTYRNLQSLVHRYDDKILVGLLTSSIECPIPYIDRNIYIMQYVRTVIIKIDKLM